jgi:anti-sigma regulatory factor (Ser/Thr protein kinase)
MTLLPGERGSADRASASFVAEPRSVTAARHYTNEQLTKWGVADQSVTAGLIVSELATNAVRHAHSGFVLELSHTDDTVRITVRDESVDPPMPRDPKPDSDSGFGLHLIALLASEWGFELGDAGKRVWVRLGSAEAKPDPLSSPLEAEIPKWGS